MITNNVLSLYDGVSIAQDALNTLGIQYNKYYASEIEEAAIKVTQFHYPNTIQLGDVRFIDGTKLQSIKLICGGSPCNDLSIMGKRNGLKVKDIVIDNLETYLKLKSEGFEFEGSSYLFFEFVRLWKETKAKYFFLENVKMKKEWEDIISKELGVEPVKINSSLVCAQNRERYYWTNIPNITIPEDRHIMLSDVIDDAVSGVGTRGRKIKKDDLKYTYITNVRKDHKSNCLVTSACGTSKYITNNNEIKNLTVTEMELLQTFDEGYTDVGLSKTARIKLIGNSWTKEVIIHLFKGLITKKNKYNLFFR